MGNPTIYDNFSSIPVETLSLNTLFNILEYYFLFKNIPKVSLYISDNTKEKIKKSNEKIKNIDKPVYGINTGFGKLFDKIISPKDLEDLQLNLIYSHCAGYGPKLPKFFSFLTLLIRIKQLSIGYSGVSLEMIENLCKYLEEQNFPSIPLYTSVGASGDLISLSHIFIKFIENYKPKIKESIAFINGTAFSLSLFITGLFFIEKLIEFSNYVLVISSYANNVSLSHFSTELKETKGNIYFKKIIEDINKIIEDIKLKNLNSSSVLLQAPYSYRCYPQIIESFYSIFDLSKSIAEGEINSATDNPLVINDNFLSTGNFHGNTISTFCDHLKIHIFQIANLSFQRMNHLLYPNFLIENEGLNSGFMITHYIASHILTELKSIINPLSIENFPVSLNQEDLVSYSENNSKKLLKSIYLTNIILSLEFLLSLQKIKLLNKELKNNNIEKFFFLENIDELLPIRSDKDFKNYESLSGLQSIFISSNKVVSFFENENLSNIL